MNTKEGIAARQQNEDYHHGRPPLGFEKAEGQLIEGEDYDQVCAVLDMVQKGGLSRRKAAQELDTSRSTISRCFKRKSLYGL
jgi:DNA invertase Pin-like site-specific DNA recombinase